MSNYQQNLIDQPVMHQMRKKDTPQYLLQDVLNNHLDKYDKREIALIKEYLAAYQRDNFQRARELITSPPLAQILEERKQEYRKVAQQRGKELYAECREKDRAAIQERIAKTQEERKKNIERALRKKNIDRLLPKNSEGIPNIKTSSAILVQKIQVIQKNEKEKRPTSLKEKLSNFFSKKRD